MSRAKDPKTGKFIKRTEPERPKRVKPKVSQADVMYQSDRCLNTVFGEHTYEKLVNGYTLDKDGTIRHKYEEKCINCGKLK